MSTGFVYDERCLAHDNGSMILDHRARAWLDVPHPERPERLARTLKVLERADVLASLTRVPARPATADELLLVHTREHVALVEAACRSGGQRQVGPEARVGPETWEPALLSVGGLLEAVDAVLGGALANAYALLRPPGHHASADRAMGFCLFNAVAIAARHAQRRHGVERVAIVDWDVHHGNGTEDVFADDPSVLFISLHQDNLYPPGRGTLDAVGGPGAEGLTVNVPLPPGTGDDGYVHAFASVVESVVAAFEPELLLISAGQDAAASDPLGRMSVTSEGFRELAARSVRLADAVCSGRLVAYQEGGYSVDHMPFCNLAIVEALAGLEPSFANDPLEVDIPAGLRPEEHDAVERAMRTYARWWDALASPAAST